MKICICCFGLFNRPKKKVTIVSSKKSNKRLPKLNINELNSSKSFFFQRRRSVVENINKINKLSINITSSIRPESPFSIQNKLNTPLKKK